ncbi:multiple epidermal growth factor-like domains protein 10 [Trichomycterus rosablanca]|uniref:multiple epidermal growth factor-like domains protein 10 n=1 Tax=Trichomycterus rosablanca TaxID=2290929 RepID=UPI002F360329
MGTAREGCWPILLWWLSSPGVTAVFGLNATLDHSYQPPCKPGHYCSESSETAVPCPRGTFAPSFWATDISGCISCPPHHYAPREGLAACLPCGPTAQQALPGQDKCQCLGEGQVFQASDGQCQCSPGYRSTQGGNACELKVYEICRDGRTRDQYGQCLDHKQWKQLCTYQVCASPELYEGFDASLGLCVCKSHAGTDSGKSECSGWCEGRTTPMLQLVCSSATLQLLYNEANRQVSTSGSVLLSVLKHWDFQGKLECDRRLGFSRPVYAIQTAEGGFHGFLRTLPAGVRMLVLETGQKGSGFADPSSTHSMVEVVFQARTSSTPMQPSTGESLES